MTRLLPLPPCKFSINLQNNLFPLRSSFPSRQSINNGVSIGYYGMPQKFRGADGGTIFSLGREVYAKAIPREQNTIPSLEKLYNSKNKIPSKSIRIEETGEYIQRKRNTAIGKGSIPNQTNDDDEILLSFKTLFNSNRNTIKTALRRNRNSGYVVPPKVIYRPHC